MELKNYYAILEDKKDAKYFMLEKEKFIELIESAKKIASRCYLCERRCGVNRISGEKGECKAPNYLLVSSEFLHLGEEPFLIPSHTIFFMGCNFHCCYCQNWSISQWVERGTKVSPTRLANIIKIRKLQGAKNVNFVGGDPTPYLPWILEVLLELKKLNVNMPVVWNSNFYMSKESMAILNEVVDFWLPDFKYGNDECAEKYSKVKNYFKIITRNLRLADLKNADMCIRHLVLPGHIKCCSYPVIEWIANNLGKRVLINVMDQYRPEHLVLEGKYPELNRILSKEEFRKVLEKVKILGLSAFT